MKFVQMVSSADSLTSNTNRLWTIFYCSTVCLLWHFCVCFTLNSAESSGQTGQSCEQRRVNKLNVYTKCEHAECIVYIVYQMWTSWIPNLHQPKPNFLKNKLKFNFGNFEAMNGLYLPDICPKISARQISPKFRKHLVCLSHQCNVSSHWGFETVAGIVETVTLGNQAIRFQWEQSCKTKSGQD